jgi:hypothetical protein
MLARWNQQLETEGRLPESTAADLRQLWLWRTDPMAKFTPDVMLNESHLAGLLLCRHMGATTAAAGTSTAPRMTLMDTSVASMRLSQLQHTVSNLTLEWAEYVARGHPVAPLSSLVDQCATRFGALCLKAQPVEVLDEPLLTQPAVEGGTQMTCKAMRWFLSAFLILYRHLHLMAVAVPAPASDKAPLLIHKPQMEASMDDFYLHQMHLRLPAAAKMQYQHEFPEMYNHVSQAAFFHNPDYQRSARASLEEINAGRATPVDVLSILLSLYPGVPIMYEEDVLPHPPGETGRSWYWLLVAGRIYLVPPTGPPLYDRDILRSLQAYLASPEAPKA